MNIQISFKDFYKIESISFYMLQLRGNKRRNIIPKSIVSTQKNNLYSLWNFHYWLVGQKFSYDFLVSIDELIFQMYSKTVILTGLEHFLKIWEGELIGRKSTTILF